MLVTLGTYRVKNKQKKPNALKRQVLLVLKKNKKISEFTSGCRFLLNNIFSYECKHA